MPRALDSQQLTITHSPTQRIDFNNAKQGFPAFDPVALVTQWTQFLEDYGFQIISDITGIDLTTLQTILQPLIDGLDLVTEALNALTSGDPTQWLAFFTDLGSLDLLNVFPSLLGAFDGIDFTDPGAILAAIAAALEDVPILGDIVAAITGNAGDLTDLTSWFTDLLGIFGDPTGLGSGTPTLSDLASIPILGPIVEGLVNGGQNVNVLNLFGSLPESLFGNVFASSLVTGSPNLLNNGGFDGSISMDGDGIWLWDSVIGHTTPGSASTVANSTLKALLSNAVSVAEGQKLSPSVWARSSGYTGSGTPVRLAVRTYLHGTQVSTTTIVSSAGPGTSWAQLSGTYTVPAGVDAVRLRLVVDTTATGGTIWFDDATLSKPGNGPFDGILSLFGLTDLEDLFDGLDVDDIWTTIINAIINPLGLLAQLTGGKLLDAQAPNIFGNLAANLQAILGGSSATLTPGSFDVDAAVSAMITDVINPLGIIEGLVPPDILANLQSLLGIDVDQSTGTFDPAEALITGPVQAAQDIVNGIVQAIKGLSGSYFSNTDATDALASQADSLAAAWASLNSVISTNTETNTGGLSAAVDFTVFPNTTNLPSIFTETYGSGTGTFGVDSGRGKTTGNSSSSRDFFGEYNVADTVTDYQRIGMVCTTAPQKDYFNPTPFFVPTPYFGPYYAENHIYGRYKDTSNWVRVRLSANGTAYLECCASGTVTTFASIAHGFQPNNAYWLECGTAGDLHTLRALAGNTPILTFTDSSHIANVGAAYRGGGIGGHLEGPSGAGSAANPGQVLYFGMADNTLAGVTGSAFRAYRASTTGVSQASGSHAVTPSGFLDTLDYKSNDITWSGGQATVSRTRNYIVNVGISISGSVNVQLFKNGSVVRTNAAAISGVQGSWTLPLVAGDYLELGLNSGGGSATGNAAGTLTFMEILGVAN